MTRNLFAKTALSALLALSSSTAFAAKSPKDFLKNAIEGDNSEIMLGQMAQDKAGSDKVRSFGQTLVSDHTTAKQQASALAKTLGVTLTDDAMPEAKEEGAKLAKLSGTDFDREFASYMVEDHRKDIAEFQDQANGDDGQTSALAKKQIPVLQKHLDMAQAIAGQSAAATGAVAATLASAPTQEDPDQWRASKLAGVNVYGPDSKKVGGITDVLISKDGKATFVVVGVGGFLGIGQKDVAIPFDQVKFTNQPLRPSWAGTASDAGTASGAIMAPSGTAGAANVGMAPGATVVGLGTPVDTTGNPNAALATGGSAQVDPVAAAAMNRSTAYPDHGTIDMPADQLKAAPTFHFAK